LESLEVPRPDPTLYSRVAFSVPRLAVTSKYTFPVPLITAADLSSFEKNVYDGEAACCAGPRDSGRHRRRASFRSRSHAQVGSDRSTSGSGLTGVCC